MRTLVIGGNSGIGAAIGDRLTQIGEQIDRPSEERLDVGNFLSIRKWFADYEFPDSIVYSAGVNHPEMLGKVRMDSLFRTYQINVLGFVEILNEVARHEKPCSILAIVSDSAHTAMRGSIAYASSKAALQHAIRCAARELAPRVRVNGISPSVVNGTPMTEKVDRLIPKIRGWSPERTKAYELSMSPSQRRCTVDEVAKLAVDILLGPEFLTGSIIPLTGGK